MDVEDPTAGAKVGDELGQRGQHLLEEDRDVLDGQPLDGSAVAIGPITAGLARPEEVDHGAPVQARHDGVGELAPQEFGQPIVEQDRGNLLDDHEPPAVIRRQAVGIGGQGPDLDGLGAAVCRGRQLLWRHPHEAGLAERAEQPQLQAEIGQPRSVEAA